MPADTARLPPPLAEVLAQIPRIALAFSGGLDSRFLAAAARLANCDVHLIHAAGPHLAPADTAYARRWAAVQGFPITFMDFNPLSLPEVEHNSRRRCYECKMALMRASKGIAESLPGTWVLCDGTQAGDLHVDRPGNRALAELGIVSPLARAGMDKARIRQGGAAIGLENPEQKARPCLLTRLAYGLAPQNELLQRIARAEEELEALLGARMDFRLRLTPAPVLQTELPLDGLAPKADAILAENGFYSVHKLISRKISGFFDSP